jgi:hypothetical protein
VRKREAIAIAEHVLAFEPTDPYALEGKENGYNDSTFDIKGRFWYVALRKKFRL